LLTIKYAYGKKTSGCSHWKWQLGNSTGKDTDEQPGKDQMVHQEQGDH
jgi:hypothetical protein